MIKATEFEIGFSEAGNIAGKFLTWDAVNGKLNQARLRLPRDYMGYAKTDVTVTFADGMKWQSRVDLTPGERVDLAEHISTFLKVYSGRWIPPWMYSKYGEKAEEKYQAFLSMYSDEDRQKLLHVLETYEFPQ